MEKILRVLGVASGRRSRFLIKNGRVSVDGQKVWNPKAEVAESSEIAVDGIVLDRHPPLFLKYHKPLDVVCTMKKAREKGRVDLTEALPGFVPPWAEEKDWEPEMATKEQLLLPWVSLSRYHPVGRLDRDTTGLLLLSGDGKLTNRLLTPAYKIRRQYTAIVEGDAEAPIRNGEFIQELLAGGVRTSEGIFAATVIEALRLPSSGNTGDKVRSRVKLIVSEGKYRMIRRILYSCGLDVVDLHRPCYGGVNLGDLQPGTIGRPTAEEVAWASRYAGDNRRQQAKAQPDLCDVHGTA